MIHDKDALRRRMKTLRSQILPEQAAQEESAVLALLHDWPAYQAARHVMLYAALPGEFPTAQILAMILRDGKALYLPRCGERPHMTAHRVEAPDCLAPGTFSVPEPPAHLPTAEPGALDLILCPGLAFDASGARLGWGAGYYDAFLAQSRALRVGLCFASQVTREALPTSVHDQAMDSILTARGILPAKHEEAIP